MDVQLGWRVCSRCQGFINVMGVGGTCLGVQMHEFSGSAEYRAVWSTFPDGVQPGWGSCTKCGRMAFRGAPGVCWDRDPHQYDEFAPNYGVQFGPNHPGTEVGWRWCSKCQCLNDLNNPSHECFAGGAHEMSSSLEYVVQRISAGMQGWWGWCRRCQGLVSGFGQGICHGGEPHEYDTGTLFNLPFGSSTVGAQSGWRRCTRCAMLAFAPNGPGACYAGDGHDLRGPYDYGVLVDTVPTSAQPGWRRCGKCQLLSYTGFESGVCPAGGTHDHSASSQYGLWPSFARHGQPGFRGCGRCGALVSVVVARGECRGGGLHDVSASAAYVVTEGFAPPGGESSWRRCAKCQALTYGGFQAGGVCFDGGGHDLTDSMLYGTFINDPPEGAEPGWGKCQVCQELVRTTGAQGACHQGQPHDVTGSAAYFVAVELPPVPPPPAGPRLAVAESADLVSVTGSGFTPGVGVELVIRLGAAALTEQLTADEAGGFSHAIQAVVPAPADATILASTADGEVATGRLTAFLPAVLAPG